MGRLITPDFITGRLHDRELVVKVGRNVDRYKMAPLYRSLLHDVFQSLRRVGKALDGELAQLVPHSGPN